MARLSDLWILTRASIKLSMRHQRTMLTLMIVLVAVLLACDGVVGAGAAKYAKSVQYQSALNLIEISSNGPSAQREITDSTLAEARNLPGVTGASPWFHVDLALSSSSDWPDSNANPGSLWATPLIPGLEPKVVLGSLPEGGLAADDIALPQSVTGGSLDALLGKTVEMEYTKVTGPGQGEPTKKSFQVVAITDNSTPAEAGPAPSYVAEATLRDMIRAAGTAGTGPLTFTTAYVRTANPGDVPAVQQALAKQGFAVSSVANQLRPLGGLFQVLSWASRALAIVLGLFCLAVGGSVSAAWTRQRGRETGLLKASGWSGGRIARALLLELACLGAATGLAGAAIGVLASLVATTIVAGRELDILPIDAWTTPGWTTVFTAALMVPVCVCLGGLRNSLSAVKLDADNALRDL